MLDFVDDELRHQSACDELDPVFAHLREELFAVGVDETHVSKIYERREWRLACDCTLPAFFEFRDTGAREPSFYEELDIAVYYSSCDS